MRRAWQVNLQPHMGGGEVYTAHLARALSELGVPSTLFVRESAAFWPRLGLPADIELVQVADGRAIAARLPAERAWLLSHGPLPRDLARDARHLRTAVAHMPPQGRDPGAFARHDLVVAVSGWVLEGLHTIKACVWREPLYGVAEARGDAGDVPRAGPVYEFDRRKLRDRALGLVYPAFFSFKGKTAYRKRAGLTLGIVSRLTTIKQFPELFRVIAPLMARREGVNLEVFGAGGYASVRDLTRALAPLGERARFWGHQDNVAAAYGALDYLLTGLPEKEALGLNVIEAQSCGLPVLAVSAPPFTETVAEGETGFLFRDPRQDGGAEFARLLDALLAGRARPDPRLAAAHLATFSFAAFRGRVERLLAEVRVR